MTTDSTVTPSDEHERARLELARTYIDDGVSLTRALEHATTVSAEVLQVERVGVWLFESVGAILRCKTLFERSRNRHTANYALASVHFPAYLRAIEERRELVADDAQTHPYTRELAEGYLTPLGITSLLDAPIYRRGVVIGVVCHEHVGPPRIWTQRDRAQAAGVADIVALLLEQAHRLEAEEALRASEAKRRELYKMDALGHFAAEAAHDFGNALAVVLGGLEVALASTSGKPSREMLLAMRDAATRAGDVARQLREFGRIETPARAHADMHELVEASRALLAFQCKDRCSLEIALESNEPLMVTIDRSHLDRVLLNLVTNACQAMPIGGKLRVATRRATRDGHRYGVLEVSDTGIGMDAGTIRRIFEPYFTTRRAAGGTGLGLASVHGIVYQGGGFIDVESRTGEGTRIAAWIPLQTE